MIDPSVDRTPRGGESQAGLRRRTQARRLFEECWTPIRRRIEDGLHRAVLDTLGPLAKSLPEDEAKRVRAVLLRDRAFVQAYLESVHAELLVSIGQFVEARGADPVSARSLSLVGHADSEFDAAIDQCAARLRNSVDTEFAAVKLRLINLLQDVDLRDSDSPFRIGLFVRAVAGALRHIGIAESDVVPLMRVLSGGLAGLLSLVYQEVEQRLAAGGAGDTVQVWHTTMSGPQGASRARGGASGSAGASAANAGRTGNEIVRPSDAQAALLSLLERLQPVGAPATGALAPAAGALPAGAEVAGGAAGAAAPGERLAFLESRAPGPGWTFDPALLTAINDALATASAAALAKGTASDAAATADLRKNLIDTASRKLDKLTIELVGLVFERIQRDRHVPAAIKEQLVRLQFPLMKVALSDPELFAEARQPARRMLDRIATTSVGWSPEGSENQDYFEQVRLAIDSVIDAPGDTSEAFDRALAKFDRFLDEYRTRDDDPVERARRALAEAENREILAIKATMQVRSAFDGVQLESYLRDFLLEGWVRVLIDASKREKTEPGLVRRYLDVIPELVWSVQPKINPGDRKRMISTIPTVLAVLREGLTMVEWPADRIQQFFGRLMNSHASAVRALELAHGSVPQFTPSTVRIKLDGFRIPTDAGNIAADQIKVSDDAVRHVLAGTDAGVTHLSEPPEGAVASPAMDHPEAVRRIESWSRGMWFDLRTAGRTERVVLRWVSPKRALYLFTNAAGDHAHSLSPDTLVAYLQSGWLIAVETAPLFNRVVDGVLFDLKHGAQAAIGAGQ